MLSHRIRPVSEILIGAGPIANDVRGDTGCGKWNLIVFPRASGAAIFFMRSICFSVKQSALRKARSGSLFDARRNSLTTNRGKGFPR
jgi:hypothetical protein